MRGLRSKLSYANVTSSLCLFLVLGGGAAIAAEELKKNSVGTKQLMKGAVTAAKVKEGSLLARNFKAGQLPAGARGAQGETGARGETGPKGELGPKGEPGNANVIYSGWRKGGNLSTETFDGTIARTTTIPAPALTATRLAISSVQVYLRLGGQQLVLPYRSNASGKSSTIAYMLSPETITVRRSTDGCSEESCLVSISSGLEYRYVITEGSTPAG